ncbi:MAG: hypothetical protein NWE86_06675 [Candidatus Bathyarchaeota archaeon]|nr:hypothetical protein [Candidatus Bathyarchaeota archaeon]
MFAIPAMITTNKTSDKMRIMTTPMNPPPISESIGLGEFPAMTSTGTKI